MTRHASYTCVDYRNNNDLSLSLVTGRESAIGLVQAVRVGFGVGCQQYLPCVDAAGREGTYQKMWHLG